MRSYRSRGRNRGKAVRGMLGIFLLLLLTTAVLYQRQMHRDASGGAASGGTAAASSDASGTRDELNTAGTAEEHDADGTTEEVETTDTTAEGNIVSTTAEVDANGTQAALAISESGGESSDISPDTDSDTSDTANTSDTSDSSAEPLRLLFAGDIYLSEYALDAYDSAGIEGMVSAGYLEKIRNADLFMANEEFPFSTRGTQAQDKQYTFRVEPARVKVLQEVGTDLLTLANNHALDYGEEALLDSVETLDGAGILHVGAGKDREAAEKPVYLSIKGQSLALFGATRVIPEADWAAGDNHAGMFSAYDGGERLAAAVQREKQQGRLVIVYLHWGIERAEEPNEVQTSLAEKLVDAGADLVLGAHPHVLQGIQIYKGKPIAYSLGNFVFGSSIPRTMLLEAELQPDQTFRLRVFPGKSSGGSTRMLTGEEGDDCLRYLESISSGIKIDEDGWVYNAG